MYKIKWNSIEFSLSTWIRSGIKLSQLKSYTLGILAFYSSVPFLHNPGRCLQVQVCTLAFFSFLYYFCCFDHYSDLILTTVLSQTSFSHISINSSTILMVSIVPESPWKDLLIYTSHVLRQLVLAEISDRSVGNYYSTVY